MINLRSVGLHVQMLHSADRQVIKLAGAVRSSVTDVMQPKNDQPDVHDFA